MGKNNFNSPSQRWKLFILCSFVPHSCFLCTLVPFYKQHHRHMWMKLAVKKEENEAGYGEIIKIIIEKVFLPETLLMVS